MFLKRIIAFLLIISILSSFVVYAFAAPVIAEEALKWGVAFIGDYIVGKALDSASDGSLEKKIYDLIHPFAEGDCTVSSDRDHHWVQSFYNDDSGLPHVEYRCSACNAYLCRGGTYQSGDGFSGRVGVFEDAYDDYVETLPVNGFDNLSGLFWYPEYSDFQVVVKNSSGGSASPAVNLFSDLPASGYQSGVNYVISAGNNCVNYTLTNTGTLRKDIRLAGSFNFPVSGQYKLHRGEYISSSFSFYNSGELFDYYENKTLNMGSSGNVVSASLYLPYYLVIPTNSVDISNTFPSDSRITNYTLNLGTIVNGDVTNVYQNTTIINETDKTLTVPSTGTTYNINNWVYNYTDRSVSGTLDTGDNYDVTFGDDNLVIHIGDDEYTYHYLVEHEVCDHTYVVTDSTSPTCTEFGSETLTCSKCGDSYTENIAPLGHDYQLVQSVPASGEDAGYDLFRCTRCGDEYQDSSFVNDNSEDASYWAWLKNWLVSFKTWLGDKLDALPGTLQLAECLSGLYAVFIDQISRPLNAHHRLPKHQPL